MKDAVANIETHVPDEGVVDDRNTMEAQLTGVSKDWQPSGHFSVQVKKYLSGLDYPVSRDELYNHAQVNGASHEVLERFGSLRGSIYPTAAEVHSALAAH